MTITDGAYHEVLQANPRYVAKSTPPATCMFVGALERPGTYHVVVDSRGSKEASLDITVNSGQCGPTPESRTVTLAAQ